MNSGATHVLLPGSKEAKLEPLTVRVAAAARLTGLSRSRIYELIQSGDLETIKVGRATLIQFRSLKALTGNAEGLLDRSRPR